MKRFVRQSIAVFIICVLMIALAGCKKEKSCTLTVNTSYSGYGEDGQDLGHGNFSAEFTVSAGDELYEWGDGHWHKENDKRGNAQVILTVTDVGDDYVFFKYTGGDGAAEYGQTIPVKSTFVIFDGTNYSHYISFTTEQ